MNIYLAGPMRGYPNFNFPAFYTAASKLREEGHTVFNPAEKDEKEYGKAAISSPTGNLKTIEKRGFSIRKALGMDTAYICATADCVALLPGWSESKGACAEKALAEALGLEVIFLHKSILK